MISLVVIDDLDGRAVSIEPHEAHSPSIIDPDAVLTFPIPVQQFQTVRRRKLQVFDAVGSVKHAELATYQPLNLRWQLARKMSIPDQLRLATGEVCDHDMTITRDVMDGKSARSVDLKIEVFLPVLARTGGVAQEVPW